MSENHNPAEWPSTDGAPASLVLRVVQGCALGWEPDARIIGNVRAGDIFRAIEEDHAEIERLRETLKRLQAHLGCDDETILIGLDEARQDIAAALNP